MKVLIVILLLIIVGFLGYNFNEQRIAKEQRRIAQAEREKEQSIQNIIYDLKEAQRKKIKQALLDRRVVKGMTRYEVKEAWGGPDGIWSGSDINDKLRSIGIFERWEYGTRTPHIPTGAVVCFGSERTVTDVFENEKQ